MEQPAVGCFIEQVADIARDHEIVLFAAPIKREEVTAQVGELRLTTSGCDDPPRCRQHRWQIDSCYMAARILGSQSNAPGRCAGTYIEHM